MENDIAELISWELAGEEEGKRGLDMQGDGWIAGANSNTP